MAKIGEFAKAYEPVAKTKNIAELTSVSTDIELIDNEFTFKDKDTKQDKTVKQKVIIVDDEQYYVPTTVIQQLKSLLEEKPGLKKFKVKKSGSTKEDTRYMVIGLD